MSILTLVLILAWGVGVTRGIGMTWLGIRT